MHTEQKGLQPRWQQKVCGCASSGRIPTSEIVRLEATLSLGLCLCEVTHLDGNWKIRNCHIPEAMCDREHCHDGGRSKITHERGLPRTASESDKNDGISVFKVRRGILRGINGNVSFTVIHFFNLNIHHIFFITPHM
ncbi:uncharacterized protein RBU33_016399 [Hipposideros larvatus]